MKRRITVFTKETFERVTFGDRPASPARAWCEGCGAEVEMLAPDEAARLSSVTTRTIYRRAEAGLIHFVETPDGLLLVCRESLSDSGAAPRQQLSSGEI